MATQYRKKGTPPNIYRQYKSLGNLAPDGGEVFAEVMALEAGSIGGGGSGGGGVATQGAQDATAAAWAMKVANGDNVVEGATTDVAVTTDANGTLSAKIRGLVKWSAERMPASLGQKAMAASLPVVLASDQSAVPVTGTFWQATQPVSGTFWQATQPVSIAAAVAVKDGAGNTIDVLTDGADAVVNTTNELVSAALGYVYNGTTWDRWRGDTTSGAWVNIKASTTVPVSGTFWQATQPVSIAAAVPVTDNAGSLTVDAPVGTPAFVRLSDGAAAITALPVTDNAGSLTVDAPLATPVFVTATPGTTGGWSKVKYAAQTTTVQTVKGGAGTFGGYYVYNPNASVAYIQVFDTVGAVTLGTTAPDMIFGIPAGSAANLELTNGVNMAAGIKLAVTTTATGLTAPGTGLDISVWYK